jgi:hypothetical protein
VKIGAARLRVDWGHLALVAGLAAFCLWYWLDARSASSSTQNLLLIQPAAVLALALCAVIAWGIVTVERETPPGEPPESAVPVVRKREWRGVLVAGLLGMLVVAVIPVGFDVATFVFLAAAMYVLGERRAIILIGYSAALAAGLSYGFKVMLSVPVPTLLF